MNPNGVRSSLSFRKMQFQNEYNFQSTNLPIFLRFECDSFVNRGTLTSPTGVGLWKKYSFIYLSGQLKAELTVSWTFCPKPQPDAFFGSDKYAGDTFSQPVIAEMDFLFDWSCFLYDCNL